MDRAKDSCTAGADSCAMEEPAGWFGESAARRALRRRGIDGEFGDDVIAFAQTARRRSMLEASREK